MEMEVCESHPKPEGECGSTISTKAATDEVYTIDDAIEACGFGPFQIRLSIFTGLIWVVESMEMMLISILGTAVRCDYDLSQWEESFLTLSMFAGMLFGAAFWGSVADRKGRKKVLLIVCICVSSIALVSAFSPNYIFLLIIRGLLGFAVSGGAQAVTFYTEFLPLKYRSYSLLLIECFFVLGSFLEAVLALSLLGYAKLNWHYLLGISAIPSFLDLFAFLMVPESPRYYLVSNQLSKAEEVLQKIAKANKKALPPGRLVTGEEKELVQINEASAETSSDIRPFVQLDPKTRRGRIKNLFATRELVWTTIYIWILMLAGTCAYYGLVLVTTELLAIVDELKADNKTNGSFLPCIDKYARNASHCQELNTDDYIKLVWITIADLMGTLMAVPFIETLGRKKTMGGGYLICSFSFFLMYICPINKNALVGLIFVERNFLAGSLVVLWVYVPEVYPTAIRGVALGMASSVARVGAILTPFIAQVLVRESIRGSLGTYAGLCVMCAISSFLLPVETKNKALQDNI
eukprot:m.147957 g.147957  ORF g.147957 m.147957 type:complete len:521 (+) comp38486_c0_seq4:56-1618(+)